MTRHRTTEGFLLIEMIVTVSIVAIVVTSVLTLYAFVLNSEKRENAKLQGMLYAQELLEVTDFIARYDWNQMQDGTWHPEILGSVWHLTAGTDLVDNKYMRAITIGPVSRQNASNGHAYGDLVASGGTVDPETKLVTATVSWDAGVLGVQSVSYQMHQARDESNLFEQIDWSGGPGQASFIDSSKFADGANVDYSAKGVLALAGNYITWDNATTTAQFDLPSNLDAEAIFVMGQTLFVGTQNSGGNGSELYSFNITNLANPVMLDEVDVGDGIYAIYANGSYMALATGVDGGELRIYNVSNPADMQLVGAVNLPTNSDAVDLDVADGYLYVIQGTSIYSFNYSNPAAPVLRDSLSLGGAVLNAVSLKGTKAYVSSSIDNKELLVVDVTNPADIRDIASYDLPGNRQAIDIYAFGFYAYIATSNSGSEPEFYMFNITNPFAPLLVATYEIGENLYTVSALSNFAFVGSGRNGQDILVLDITNPSAITLETGYEVKGTATDIFPTPEAIYLATTSNDSELVIISVNSNVPLYPGEAYAESSTFDTQSPTSTYNWIDWIGETSATTAIKFQIATNNDGLVWNYVGPDGTASTYYTAITRELVAYTTHLNKRYLRYKVILSSTDRETTPYLYGVDMSYSR